MMNFRIRPNGLMLLALGTGLSGIAQAQSEDRRFYISPMGTYTVFDNGRSTQGDNGPGGSIAVGKRFTANLDLEIFGHYNNLPNGGTGKDFKLYGAGAGANIYPFPSNPIFGGAYVRLAVSRGQGKDLQGVIADYTTTLFDAGVGYNFTISKEALGPFGPGMALRLEALYRHDAHGRELAGIDAGPDQYFQDIVFGLGLRIPLGGRAGAPIPAPVEPVAVVPVEEPAPVEEVVAPPPPCEPPVPGQPVNLDGCKEGDTFVLRGVNFEFDKAKLTVNAKQLLDPVADALIARPDIKIEVDGHTDSRGSDAYNQKLSEARAASVMAYLVERGVAADRMTSKGFGESMPVADNATDDGRELNRRVEIKITESGSGDAAATADEAAPAEEAAPVEESAPAEEAPVEESAPADEASAEEAVSEEAPAEEAPAEEAPADDAAVEDEAPVDEAPAEEAAFDDVPADEATVEG